ncbi:MAG TPA: gluconokinase [Vicinamibacterales bacterium]|nr:gluconokinase [Vicinamibacterales bacterium]
MIGNVPPRAIILIGPAGTGKTTVGQALASDIGARFFDADDAHTPANVAKMRRGEALTDADRAPWLDRVRAWCMDALHACEVVVVACSALRQRYRERLTQNDPRFTIVYLDVPRDVLALRLAERQGHFAGPDLLSSQLATFERPHDAVVIDGRSTVRAQVDAIRAALQL